MDEGAAAKSVLAQLGVGGLLVVVVAYAMFKVFGLFISHWDKQETARTKAYETSATAHAAALVRVADTMTGLVQALDERVASAFTGTTAALNNLTNALADVKISIGRLEGKLDAFLDATERTPVGVEVPRPDDRPSARSGTIAARRSRDDDR